MKFTRLITFFMVMAIACSVWTPAPAFASQVSSSASAAVAAKPKPQPKSKTKALKTTVIKWKNLSGGVMTLTLLSLDGKNPNYTFSVANNAVSNFVFNAGYYSFKVTSSACSELWSGRNRYAARKIVSPIYMCDYLKDPRRRRN